MSIMKEFKDFALKGNVIDLAVGVIIGAAFGKIVTSLVDDVIMPPIGKLMGGVDFANMFINLSDTPVQTIAEAKAKGIATLNYGLFINNIIYFLIVAFSIFMVVRAFNKIRAKQVAAEQAAEPTTKECPHCLSTVPVKATRCGHCTSTL